MISVSNTHENQLDLHHSVSFYCCGRQLAGLLVAVAKQV
jgi:hypothetical protein